MTSAPSTKLTSTSRALILLIISKDMTNTNIHFNIIKTYFKVRDIDL